MRSRLSPRKVIDMEDLTLVFQWFAVQIGRFLAVCTDNWFLSILLFLMVLNLVVSVILFVTGGKHD